MVWKTSGQLIYEFVQSLPSSDGVLRARWEALDERTQHAFEQVGQELEQRGVDRVRHRLRDLLVLQAQARPESAEAYHRVSAWLDADR